MRARLRIVSFTSLAPVLVVAAVVAQSAAADRPAALPGIPKDVAGFEHWTKMTFKPLPARGGEAHHGLKNVYVNRKRSRLVGGGKQRVPYPTGTIVVKTASTDGVVTLVAIARKQRAGNGGWKWAEYTRSSPNDRLSFLAGGSVYTGCHVGAKPTDWIFTRVRR
jgi:cytochrome P460